jgi:hypothetical protein
MKKKVKLLLNIQAIISFRILYSLTFGPKTQRAALRTIIVKLEVAACKYLHLLKWAV